MATAAHGAGDGLDSAQQSGRAVGRIPSQQRLRLLVVDPDLPTAERFMLGLYGHRIDSRLCGDGAEALIALGRYNVDAILAAANLAVLPGPQLVKAVRRHKPTLPILIGASQEDAQLAIAALDTGANAAVARPYRLPELIPLLRATFPNASIDDIPAVLAAGPLQVDAATHQARFNGRPLALSPREFDLLRYLLANADRVVTPAQIRENVWGLGGGEGSNTIAVHIRRIRNRLGEDCRNPSMILTVRGLGYRLVLPEQKTTEP